jgi:hypothetical protein
MILSNSNTNKKAIFAGIFAPPGRNLVGKRGREIPLRNPAMGVNAEKYSVKAEVQLDATRLGSLCRLCVISETLIPFSLCAT